MNHFDLTILCSYGRQCCLLGQPEGCADCQVFLFLVLFPCMHPFSPAINGYVRDTLPGLVMGQHQRVRWHLLNVGDAKDIHSIHFHGQVFTIRMDQEYRLGVYNLYPGKARNRWLCIIILACGIE